MSDFIATQKVVDKEGRATEYLEEVIYNLSINTGSPGSSDAGQPGTMRRDDDYLYICYDNDSWGRIALTKGY